MKKIESKVIKYNILSNERNKLESFNHLNTEPTNDTNTNYNEINKFTNFFIKNIIKSSNNAIKLNKSIHGSSKLTNKYKYLMKLNKQNKYLNDNILDNIFSRNNNEIDDKINHTVIPQNLKQNLNNNKNESNFSLHHKKKAISCNFNKKKLFIKPLISNSDRLNISYYKTGLMTPKNTLKISHYIDIPNEYINKNINNENDKFARLKILLDKKKMENKNMVDSIIKNNLKTEKIPKIFIYKLHKKYFGK
jgi:hypothetical protein